MAPFFFEGCKDMREAILETETATPYIRYKLKARIFEVGYCTFQDFAAGVNIHPVMLSKIVNGHLFPSPKLQRRMAEELGLTIREMRELL